jgi:tetratricopeptide (TPR) repeat protein
MTDYLQEALKDFDRAIALDDKDGRAIVSRGQIYRQMGFYDEALKEFDHAIELDDKNGWAIVSRGQTYRQMGRYDEALEDFDRAIELDDKDGRAVLSRGQTYRQMGRYDEALKDSDRAIELDDKDGRAVLSRGQTYRQMGCYDEALKDFERAIELDPHFQHEGQKEIGLVFESLGKHQEAVDAFLRALTAQPACVECWISLVGAYEALHSRAEIPRLLREASIPDANTALVIVCRAEAMRTMDYLQEALKDFDRAIALDQTIVDVWGNERGLLLSYLGQYADALESYEQVLEKKPDDYATLYNIAIATARWKGLPDAETQIDAARSTLGGLLNTDARGSALYGLGGLAALEGNVDQALDYLRQAISLEKQAIDWARHDIAWLDLRPDSRFQQLISDSIR